MIIGVILASAFSAILMYAQALILDKIGIVSGLFFGFTFGIAGSGTAVPGYVANLTNIERLYQMCAFLPLPGIFIALLPNREDK